MAGQHEQLKPGITGSAPEVGWYPDPLQPGQLRWWDGATWTDHVATPPPAGEGSGDGHGGGGNGGEGGQSARARPSPFARRWTALALVVALLVIVLAVVLQGSPPALYWDGEPIVGAGQVLSRAEVAMTDVAGADEGSISPDSRCWFLLPNESAHDIESELRCGPLLLPWSARSAPWLAYKLSATQAGTKMRLSVTMRPAPTTTVALRSSQVLRRPGGGSAPEGDGGVEAPVVPRQRPGWAGLLRSPPTGLSVAPVGDVIGDWGSSYRLVAYGERRWLQAGLDRGALRQAYEPKGSTVASSRVKLLLPPKGDVFVVAELALSAGEAAGAVPAQANGSAGPSSDQPLLEVAEGTTAVTFPTPSGPNPDLVAAVPAKSQPVLQVMDKGLSQRVSLTNGELAAGPAVLSRVGTDDRLSASATLDGTRVRVVDAELVWFAGSDGGTVPPEQDEAYLQVLASTSPSGASLPVSDFTLVLPGGEVVGAQALPDSDRQAVVVGFLVPASFSNGTVVVSSGGTPLSVPVRFE